MSKILADRSKDAERKFIMECIDVYRELPCLWKVKCEEYMNRQKKEQAYEKLILKYRERYEDATKEDVKKKFNTLRTNFRKELKKIRDSNKSGAGTEELYVPNLWYFEEMKFLEDTETPKKSRNTIAAMSISCEDDNFEVIEDDHFTPTEIVTSTPTHPNASTSVGNSKCKRKKGDETSELISLVCQRLRKKDDDDNLTLAKTWVAEIAKMDEKQQIFAKKAINDIIFEGQMGTLQRDSVQINAPIPSRANTPYNFLSHGSYETAQGSSCGIPSRTSFLLPNQCVNSGDNNPMAEYFANFQP